MISSFLLFSCQETTEKAIEAKEAKRKSDSIMKEFEKINNSLKSIDTNLTRPGNVGGDSTGVSRHQN